MEKKDFSLLDILDLLKTRWWILVIAAIVLGSVGAVYSCIAYDPVYSSSVTVYVNNQTTGQDTNTADDVSQVKWAKDVVNSYLALLKTNDFMEDISAEYKARFPEAWAEKTYSAIKLAKSCKYTLIEETYLFTFTVTTHDKDVSCNIAKIFEELAPKKIMEHEKRESISIADSARPATEPSNTRNLGRNTVIGALLGAILAFLVLLIIEVSDIRVKDEDDIIDNYAVPLLGSVPNFESAKKRGYGYGKK